jgi:acetate kinase
LTDSIQAEDILNRKSGWKALTGTTDFRLITQRAELSSGSESPDRLAFDLFVDRILNYIGSYYLKLGGAVDALVFAGMIGEKSRELREAVGRRVGCLGFVPLDGERNEGADGVEGVVVDVGADVGSGSGSWSVEGEERGRRLLVCRTDEQVRRISSSNLKLWLISHLFLV